MTQKNNQKLRIGIVGAGSIVRARHLPALKNLLSRNRSGFEFDYESSETRARYANAKLGDLLAIQT
jgi:predicted dehydrogenase